MRFVHTADWQLGMTRHFLGAASGGEAQARFAEARLDAVRALGALADAGGAAFVLVCGDVFESNLLSAAVVARACDALASFRTPVLLLPGNHDPADPASVLRRADFARRAPAHVTVLDTPGVHVVAPGVEVVAAPWPTKRPLGDLAADAVRGLDPAPPGVVRVLAAHGGLDVLRPEGSARDDPALVRVEPLRAALADGRVHYAALGDRHSHWHLPGEPRIRYAGAPEVTDHDEVDPGNVLVVDVHREGGDDGGGAVAVRPERVGRWRFTAHRAWLDTADDVDALDAWLAARPDKQRTAARLELVGTLTLREHARLEGLLAEHREVFAAVEVSATRSELVTRPDAADLGALESLGLCGFALGAARELHDAAGHDEAARDALGLLHRLAAGAR